MRPRRLGGLLLPLGLSASIPIGPTPWRRDGFQVVDSSLPSPIPLPAHKRDARVTRHNFAEVRVESHLVGACRAYYNYGSYLNRTQSQLNISSEHPHKRLYYSHTQDQNLHGLTRLLEKVRCR